MARKDEDNYKAGVDFEWVAAKDGKGNPIKDGKGGTVKTRKFFSKAEKEAMKAPKAEAPTRTAVKALKKAAPKPEAKKVTATAKASGSFAPPASSKASVKVDRKAAPAVKSSTGGPARTARPKFDVNYARWKAMDMAERKRLGLPTSVIGGEMGFNRFMTGITGKDYTMRTK